MAYNRIYFLLIASALCASAYANAGMAGMRPMPSTEDQESMDLMRRAVDNTKKMAREMGAVALPVISPAVVQGQAQGSTNSMNMSMEVVRMMDSISTMEEYSKMFDLDMPDPDENTKDLVTLNQAMCGLELRTVELDLPPLPGITYFPSCVRLMRCKGCCGDRQTCQPVNQTAVEIKILKHPIEMMEKMMRRSRSPPPHRQGSGARSLSLSRPRRGQMEYDTATVYNHTGCACQCTIKKEDCDAKTQVYSERNCACQCKDQRSKLECQSKSRTHFWDDNSCKCYCKNYFGTMCGDGLEFSHAFCRCKIKQG